MDRDVVGNAWACLLPALLESYDSQATLPAIAPRPLLIVNGANDERCPVAGLCAPLAACLRAYAAHGAAHNLHCHIEPDAGHEV